MRNKYTCDECGKEVHFVHPRKDGYRVVCGRCFRKNKKVMPDKRFYVEVEE